MTRFNQQRFPVRKFPPNRSWTASQLAVFTVIPANSKVVLGTFVLSNSGIDETILRTVGLMAIKSDQSIADEDQIGAFGMIVVSDTAAALGVTAIPGPISDADNDGWFVYKPWVQAFEFITTTGMYLDTVQYEIDSKAKRIVNDGSTIALVAENAHATDGASLGLQIRMLTMVKGT